MSTVTTDQQPIPSSSSDSAPATPTGGKINLFNRKKKSAVNLGSSPSLDNLVSGSGGSSLKSGQSMESLQDKTATESGPGSVGSGKGIKNIFKRKGAKSESGSGSGSGSIGSIKDGERADENEDNKERASEDDGVLSYDSETDVNSLPRPNTAGVLTPSKKPNEPIPGKPLHSATFSQATGTTANSQSEKLPPRSAADILKAPFRRGTSPTPLGKEDTPTKNGGTSNKLAWANTNLPAHSETAEMRPATSGGESRRSEDRGRRTGRTSVGTSDASEISLNQDNSSSNGSQTGRTWPGGIITKDHASPGTLADPYNPDGTIVQTTVTPPTPTDGSNHFSPKSPVGAVVSGGTTRTRNRTNSLSGTPSKLSQSMSVPLTPTSETPLPKEGGSPGGTNQAGAGGFFQSMFSAAQTAATTISNSIANTNLANNGPGGRPRTATGLSDKSDNNDKENISQGASEGDRRAEPQRRLAVETLGHGELSLGSLGILPSPKKVPEGGNSVSRSNNSPDGDQAAAPHNDENASDPYSATSMKSPTPFSAVSNQDANFETASNSPINHTTRTGDSQRPIRTPVAEDSAFHSGSHRDSLPAAGTMTPERSSILATNEMDDTWFADGDRRRSGSVKSSTGIGRMRGSSAASGGNVQPAPKPTGFAVASKKRNRDFHTLFRSVPEDDYLIEDYGCALQKEILLQGRFYVSEGHICFNSNIFGWINTLVISFDEVVSVEKKSTAMVFPNAIVIQTLHARHVFASFISRDSTYDLIVGIWRIGHPQLVANLTGVRLEENTATGEVEDQEQVDGGSEYEEDEEEDEYEDDSDENLGESYTDAGDGLIETKTNGDSGASKPVSRKASQQPVAGAASGEAAPGAAAVADYPGPATHPPTACTDAADHAHYDKPLCDEIIPAPLGKVYSLAYGPGSYPFISRFLAEEEKVLEIQIPDKGEWTEGEGGKKVRSFSYIKPLGGPIGPKQTKCLITETIEFCDLEDHVSVVVATQTPDVPSGNVFVVKSKYCLMWGEGGTTRMIANCTVEWSGKSWLKGPIEKGASDGQIAYNADLIKALKAECLPKEPASKSAKLKGKKKRKAMEAKGEAIGRSVGGTVKGRAAQAAGFSSPAEMESWGVFAPLKTYLGPVVDMIQPLVGGNLSLIIICILVVMLLLSRRGNQTASVTVIRSGPTGGAQYWDQAWQREEEGLWEWLEDRTGLGGIGDIGRGRRMSSFEKELGSRRGALSARMKEREVEEAIGIMEERLETLKKVVEGRKAKNPDPEL